MLIAWLSFSQLRPDRPFMLTVLHLPPQLFTVLPTVLLAFVDFFGQKYAYRTTYISTLHFLSLLFHFFIAAQTALQFVHKDTSLFCFITNYNSLFSGRALNYSFWEDP